MCLSPRKGIGMVPRGRNFIVGCSDGDVFAFQAKVRKNRASVLFEEVPRSSPAKPALQCLTVELKGGVKFQRRSGTVQEKTYPVC